jgi:hypothetical protein
MVLSDYGHRASLRSLLPFALVQREAHLHAGLQLVEFAVEDAVAVEIDFLPVTGRPDEAMVGEQLPDGTGCGRFVMLDDAPQPAHAILQTALYRIESIAHGDIDVLTGMVLGWVARHRNLAFRQYEVNGDMVELALPAVAVVGLDHDMAAGDPGMKPLQRCGAVPDPRFDGFGGGHVAKGDPERYLHGKDPRSAVR